MRGVLDGIRVIDVGRYVAGPCCATLLGYLGAQVIRVEKPDGGEDRYVAPLEVDGAQRTTDQLDGIARVGRREREFGD
jgi:crotonobetainyl-CoA:carnitine CoA-transferase CaiB-like acyl-CoA transferase